MASLLLGAAAGVLLIDSFTSEGTKQTVTDSVVSQAIVSASTKLDNRCINAVDTEQVFDFNSTDTGDYAALVSRLRNPWLDRPLTGSGQQNAYLGTQSPCERCRQVVEGIHDERVEVETTSKPYDLPNEASPTLETMMTTGSAPVDSDELGPCDLLCDNVRVDGVAQSLTVNASGTCSFDSSSRTAVQQEVQAALEATLSSQKDLFGSIEGSLLTTNDQTAVANLSTTMSQVVDTTVLNSLAQDIQATQKITFEQPLRSMYATNFSQSAEIHADFKMVVVSDLANSLRQSAAYSVATDILDKNDTTGDALNNLREGSRILSSIVGSVMVIMACAAGVFLLVVGGLWLFGPKKVREAMDKRAERASDQAAAAIGRS